MALSIGQRVTLVKIDDMLAMRHRYEMEIRQTLDPKPVGYEGRKTLLAVIRQRGKRKEFYLDMAADDILLDGWGLVCVVVLRRKIACSAQFVVGRCV